MLEGSKTPLSLNGQPLFGAWIFLKNNCEYAKEKKIKKENNLFPFPIIILATSVIMQ